MNIEFQACEANPDSPRLRSLSPRQGVLTLHGYGIQVRVDRGHLVVEDGLGSERRRARFPRVGHGLKRLVVVGSDGMVLPAALRWLADQKASFVMLERDGKVLTTTGPVRPSDARLRRMLNLLQVIGALLDRVEIDRQETSGTRSIVARQKFLDVKTADTISGYRTQLGQTETSERIRIIESQCGWRLLVDVAKFTVKLSQKR